MNRLAMLALLLVAAAGWLTFEGVLHYWPAMLGWPLGLASTIAYVVTIPLYLRSACELCGHSLFKHYGLSMPCTICDCTPGYRDMLRWPLFRQ